MSKFIFVNPNQGGLSSNQRAVISKIYAASKGVHPVTLEDLPTVKSKGVLDDTRKIIDGLIEEGYVTKVGDSFYVLTGKGHKSTYITGYRHINPSEERKARAERARLAAGTKKVLKPGYFPGGL